MFAQPCPTSIPTVITLSTLRLQCTGAAGVATGTGFLFSFAFPELGADVEVVTIITNKHVLQGATELATWVTLIPKGTIEAMDDSCRIPGAQHQQITIANPFARTAHHPSPGVDLCAIAVSDVWADIVQRHSVRHTVLGEGWLPSPELRNILRPIEPIVMVEYPNGLWDEANNLPVVRNGLTGSHPLIDWNQQKKFLVDAACFPGSSGSPVFLFQDGMFRASAENYSPGTRASLLGVLWGGPLFKYEGKIEQQPIPTGTTGVPVISAMMNLGYVVRADEILALKDVIRPMIRK